MTIKKIFIIILSFIFYFHGIGQTCSNNRKVINTKEKDGNCSIVVKLKNIGYLNSLYMNNGYDMYDFDSLDIADGIDTICLNLDEPKGVSLFINNDAENKFQFYLCEGNYNLNIDCKNKTALVVGSPLNDEYKEMMRVQDSIYKKYNIMHAILYPYNKMNSDSAHELLRKYLPLCDSLSTIHSNKFYETHPASFLTLENIFFILQYTFDDPGYDTTVYNLKKLKTLFDKLDTSLKKYKMYGECVELFNKERVKPPEIPKPLWNGK